MRSKAKTKRKIKKTKSDNGLFPEGKFDSRLDQLDREKYAPKSTGRRGDLRDQRRLLAAADTRFDNALDRLDRERRTSMKVAELSAKIHPLEQRASKAEHSLQALYQALEAFAGSVRMIENLPNRDEESYKALSHAVGYLANAVAAIKNLPGN